MWGSSLICRLRMTNWTLTGAAQYILWCWAAAVWAALGPFCAGAHAGAMPAQLLTAIHQPALERALLHNFAGGCGVAHMFAHPLAVTHQLPPDVCLAALGGG